MLFTLRENLSENFSEFVFVSFRLIDLIIICCTSIIISPNPNSTADKMRKKNVKDSMLRLSNTNPRISTIMYKVIQSNSAVNKRCKAVLMFNAILANIMKNSINTKFKSPSTKNYKY